MNLFLLSRRPRKLAKLHCNKHVVKMILETTQLLWTAVHCGNKTMPKTVHKPYRKTHVWHPTAMWVRESPQNHAFTIKVGLALCKEYTRRYGKVHKCQSHLLELKQLGYYEPLERRPYKSKRGTFSKKCTPFPCAMPPDCVVERDGKVNAVKSYRKYYKKKAKDWAVKGMPMKWM